MEEQHNVQMTQALAAKETVHARLLEQQLNQREVEHRKVYSQSPHGQYTHILIYILFELKSKLFSSFLYSFPYLPPYFLLLLKNNNINILSSNPYKLYRLWIMHYVSKNNTMLNVLSY